MKQYKIDKFIENNLDAAKLYSNIGNKSYEIMSYANAVDGYIMQNDSVAADSILSICWPLVHNNLDREQLLLPSVLSYTIEYGSTDEIRSLLDEYQDIELSNNDALNFAQGYSRIGEYEKALSVISAIKMDNSILDSLKYLSIKTVIYENQGDYEVALALFRKYSAMLEGYQKNLLSQDLLFAEEKHKLEIANVVKDQKRDRIIWISICGSCGLLLLVGWLYYRNRLSHSRRLIAEKENENLRLAQENLNKEKARVELERDNLEELLNEQTQLSKPIQDTIKTRLEMLNSLLAKEITNNSDYASPYNKWIESICNNKDEFMNSTRLAFKASHPRFIEFLEQHNLTESEMNYVCLYAIGLRGKEVGEYIHLKRHYNVSSDIRKKLGIDEHETNIGLYIRKKMNEL